MNWVAQKERIATEEGDWVGLNIYSWQRTKKGNGSDG